MSQTSTEPALSRTQLTVLMLSVLVVALCGIAYELIIAAVSSYLLGNSVYQFSITIGLFMFAMGVGSFLTKRFEHDLVSSFVAIEIAVALVGGLCSTLLFAVFPYYVYYKPVMYSLILIIGGLVGLEIPLLTRILSRVDSIRDSLANVLALDYIGALIGSVAFPLLLLPNFGLFRSSFAIGLLNIGVVFFTLIVFGPALKRRWLFQFAAWSITAVLLGGAIYSEKIRSFAESQLFGHSIIYTKQTEYQRIIVTQNDRNGKLRLYIDGHLQFAELDEHRYHESLVHPVMSLPGPRKKILILGGGDGLAAREILKYGEVERIDLVDIDVAITDLCSTHGHIRKLNGDSLRNPKLHIHNTDAGPFVRESRGRFDRIIIDLPDPHNETLARLYSTTFYKMIRRSLAPGGYFVTQSGSPLSTREAYWCIGRTIEAAGMEVFSYHIPIPSFGIWGFHLAGADGKTVQGPFPIPGTTRYLTPQILTASTIFSRDTKRIPGPVNAHFQPKLYQLYRMSEER